MDIMTLCTLIRIDLRKMCVRTITCLSIISVYMLFEMFRLTSIGSAMGVVITSGDLIASILSGGKYSLSIEWFCLMLISVIGSAEFFRPDDAINLQLYLWVKSLKRIFVARILAILASLIVQFIVVASVAMVLGAIFGRVDFTSSHPFISILQVSSSETELVLTSRFVFTILCNFFILTGIIALALLGLSYLTTTYIASIIVITASLYFLYMPTVISLFSLAEVLHLRPFRQDSLEVGTAFIVLLASAVIVSIATFFAGKYFGRRRIIV